MANNFNNYHKEVLKHFTNPKNKGEIKNANGIGEVGNPACGDVMKIYLKVSNGIIKDAKFQTFGCVAAIASSDVLCDIIKGKTIEEAKKIKDKDIMSALKSLPTIKIHCSVLGSSALKKAIKNYESKK